VAIDIGTGDGRGLIRRARSEPRALFIGVDAVAEAMRRTSARAARPAARGGTPNAIFLVAAAEQLPGALAGRGDEVSVVLPWGSLLRGLLSADASMIGRLRALLRPGGTIELLLSVEPTDHRPGLPVLTEQAVAELASPYAAVGLALESCRPATRADVARLGSTWAKRLAIPERRAAWLLVLKRRRETG